MKKISLGKSSKREMKIILLFLLFPIFSAVLNAFDFGAPYQDVQAWIETGCVKYKVFDSSRGVWNESSSCLIGNQSNLIVANGVVAWINSNCVEYAVYDPISGTWKNGIKCEGSGVPSNLTNANGVVAWVNSNCIEYVVFDPIRGTWKYGITCTGYEVPANLTNANGVVAWINSNCVEYIVYDPIGGAWKHGIKCTGYAIPASLTNANGVVAWINSNCVECVIYDPVLGSWVYKIECFGYGDPYGLFIANSTVNFWTASQPFTRGYDHYSGNWYDGPTLPLAYFVASPGWGNGEYWVHFKDMSIGANGYSWNFSDGTTSNQPSPVHEFVLGNFYVNYYVTGPGGNSSFGAWIKTDSTAPTGSISINNGDLMTNSPEVTLTLSASDNSGTVSSMRFSNDNSTWSSWEPYAASKFWTLSSDLGMKNVFVQFEDALENISASYSDSIELAPEVSLRVLSPNGGEKWECGSTQNITWASTGTIDTVKIDYSIDSGISWNTISASTANSGSYNWTVANTPAGTCLIKISDIADTVVDTSNATFTIATPLTITVTVPNGGEIWRINAYQYIRWNWTGVFSNVRIEYSTNNGATWKIIGASKPNVGSFRWKVAGPTSINCRVRVSSTLGTPSDISNSVFRIRN